MGCMDLIIVHMSMLVLKITLSSANAVSTIHTYTRAHTVDIFTLFNYHLSRSMPDCLDFHFCDMRSVV